MSSAGPIFSQHKRTESIIKRTGRAHSHTQRSFKEKKKKGEKKKKIIVKNDFILFFSWDEGEEEV